jgi:hypothetical protein
MSINTEISRQGRAWRLAAGPRRALLTAASIIAALWLACAPAIFAGNPISVDAAGNAQSWNQASFPIIVNIESGSGDPTFGGLGRDLEGNVVFDFTECVQIAVESLEAWEDVEVAEIDFRIGPFIQRDVAGFDFMALFQSPPAGSNPIIFDEDGTDFAALGLGPEVLGVAGPTAFSGDTIVQGRAAVQGANLADEVAFSGRPAVRRRLVAVTTHEMGHFLGFGHAEVNGSYAFSFDRLPGNLGTPTFTQIELMYPIASPTEFTRVTPHFDDKHIAARLYPLTPVEEPEEGDFAGYGTLTGEIFDGLGLGLWGAVVIARDPSDPVNKAAGVIAGSYTDFVSPNPVAEIARQQRSYIIDALVPSSYYIHTAHATAGSYSSPIVVSPDITDAETQVSAFYPGPDDFYNGPKTAFDNPATKVTVEVAANETQEGLDIQLNNYVGVDFEEVVFEQEPNDSRFDAGPQDVLFGVRIVGTIQKNDNASAVGLVDLYEDFYRFQVPEDQCFTFDFETGECTEDEDGEPVIGASVQALLIQRGSTNSDLDILIFSEGGGIATFGGATAATEAERAGVPFLRAGTYVVGVSVDDVDSFTGPISYTLDIGFPVITPAPVPPPAGLVTR